MTKQSNIHWLRSAATALMSRARLAGQAGLSFIGARDMYKALGYDRTLTITKFHDRYFRSGIAARIVNAYPDATWSKTPTIRERTDEPGRNHETDPTEFESALATVFEKHRVFQYIKRTDRIAGIGEFGILLLGMPGDMKRPASKVNGISGLLFLSPFSQQHVDITKFEDNVTSPRFGLPTEYRVTVANEISATSSRTRTFPVHHSRVLHISDGLLESDVFGVPRLHQVWNYLDDLDKVVGGSAEAVWRTMDRGIQWDVDKEMTLEEEDAVDLSNEIEEYEHGLRRHVRTKGITATVLGSDVPDPRGPFNVVISLIAATIHIPQRILVGAEQGQLASGQDVRNFAAAVLERRTNYAEPMVLRPFVDKLIDIQVVPTPENGYDVIWPDFISLSAQEKVDIAARAGQGIRNVAASLEKGIAIISPAEFRQEYLDLPAEISGDIPEPPAASGRKQREQLPEPDGDRTEPGQRI